MTTRKLDARTLRVISRRLKKAARGWYNSVTPGMGLVGFHVWSQAEDLLNTARAIESAAKKKATR